MIKALIIDDEDNARNSLKDDVQEYCKNIQIVGEASGVQSGIETIEKLKPELVFLDVEMGDGTGFDLLEKVAENSGGLNSIHFKVIFTTAHSKFAIKAIRFSALDFLLKPVDPDELIEAVDKVEKSQTVKDSSVNYHVLFENLNKLNKTSKKIVLNTSESVQVYNIDDIVRCESQRNYTKFYFKEDKPLLVSKTLKDFDEILTEHGFERIHHSHLININYLKKYVKTDGGYAVMEDGSEVPVAQRKREYLLKYLSNL